MNAGFRNGPHARVTTQGEDATELRFGPEFDAPSASYRALAYHEVAEVLRMREEIVRKEGVPPEKLYPPVDRENQRFHTARKHAHRFDNIKKSEACAAIRRTITTETDARGEPRFHPFEVAQIMNLMPEDAEEARGLIPSLQKKVDLDDDVLNHLLSAIRALV
ncbi:DNA-directed RNA polymerase II subunit RPB4 [Porphyridium purpureum]|uniref:DNA-directed RNA polymerase II subunit RPB4 n=1 Tax=Porphyridium purpureum TaxID=35688 RepID=A0A5J4Z1H1_PORPP|nr:DNA-directed RNA polymerase II subunit RPB4 [Porphyridium purpureum]|eukprot:POR0473..scf295_1